MPSDDGRKAGSEVPPVTRLFEEALQAGKCLIIPGVYDCITARLAERAGFPAVFISAYALRASLHGTLEPGPHHGADMAAAVERIRAAVSLPVIADAGPASGHGPQAGGWGSPSEAAAALESAGADGILLTAAGPEEISRTAVGLRGGNTPLIAAVQADGSESPVQGDGPGGHGAGDSGEDGAEDPGGSIIEEPDAFLRAGASMVVAPETYSIRQLEQFAGEVKGPAAVFGGIPGRPGSFEKMSTYASMGIAAAFYPVMALYTATRATAQIYGTANMFSGLTADMASQQMTDPEWYREFLG